MRYQPIKPGEKTCRNCVKFTTANTCWIKAPCCEHDCKSFEARIKEQENERLKTELDRAVNLSHGVVSVETYEAAVKEIKRLKQPIPESPELVKWRSYYLNCRQQDFDSDTDFRNRKNKITVSYINALESEIKKLRGEE
jgi:hypothetical protein